LADSRSDSIISEHFATKALDNPLWQYACEVYSQPGVEATLLALQDDHGADVNLILQALWLANENIEWTQDCIPNDYVKWVEEQVLPLRNMRRSMKTDWPQYDDFRQHVKALELKAEQYALAMLFTPDFLASQKCGGKNGIELIASNIFLLAKHCNIAYTEFDSLIKKI
tara:strand:+ start:560 stop:1066 length:507 start_codon:yes stop_codon:yes gene_type:complete